jgi:hypothetical protein
MRIFLILSKAQIIRSFLLGEHLFVGGHVDVGSGSVGSFAGHGGGLAGWLFSDGLLGFGCFAGVLEFGEAGLGDRFLDGLLGNLGNAGGFGSRWSGGLGGGWSSEGNSLGGSGFEAPAVTVASNNTLSDTTLGGKRGHGGVAASRCFLGGLESEVLDGGLELIISVKVGGMTGEVDGSAHFGFEFVDDKSNFKASVWSPDLLRINSSEFEAPFADDDDLSLEGVNWNVRELSSEGGNGLGWEVGGDEEVWVGHEEVGAWFLDVDLKHLSHLLGDSFSVSTVLDEAGEKFFKGWFVAHLIIRNYFNFQKPAKTI